MLNLILRFLIILLFITNIACSQNKKGEETYKTYCATCHGEDMRGGNSSSLIDSEWKFGADKRALENNIKFGIENSGMPAFGNTITDADIAELLNYIMEEKGSGSDSKVEYEKQIETFDYKVNIEIISENLDEPWGIAFLNPVKALITEKSGRLRIIENDELLSEPVAGIPEVFAYGQGGLLDVAVDPDYEKNGWIYLSYSHEIDDEGMTKIVRGKIIENNWTNEEVLFQAPSDSYRETKHHFGSRIVFDNKGHLYFSIGDRGKRDDAQNLMKPNGKIHRIFRDGKIPTDNPFLSVEGAIPSIFAYGSRNSQGLAIDPETDLLWSTEHGQKGGDELNIIRSGKNYGWADVTYGRNYDGSISTEETKLPGMEIPIIFWRPSIATCGLDYYSGNLFPKWKGHLLAGALKFEEVKILDIEEGRVIHQETLIKDMGRVRDVSQSPDGSIYILLNDPGKILRLTPEN